MRAAACLSLIAVLSACSDERSTSTSNEARATAAAAADGGPAACEVLTEPDAERALGRPVEKLPSDGGPAGLDICQYGYQGEQITDMGNASVTVQPLDLASVRSGAEAQGYRFEAVPGLGDAAYYSAEVGLYVGKGNRTAIYLLAAKGMDDPKGKAIALAQATVGRL